MQFTFLDFAGNVLFIRDDAERAQWTVEELSLDLEFPYLADKAISIGQRVFFIDPVGKHQIYEVKQAKTVQPDGFQQVTAEHICISELSDCHMDDKEITDESCVSTLSGILTGTGWSVGVKTYNPTSSVDLSRGSVWQAVLQIKDNWNVYIEPRVTLNDDGTILRKLDIFNTDGVFNGVRLSVDKNMLDPSVTYDDSEVATALYGYGGTIHDQSGKGEDTECSFENVVWTKTADHPAKPKGQKYLEDPAATKAYGRNGKARFSYFQNNDITDPEVLLQKTWETLKTVSSPSVSIDGTVADLYRMGYADQPLALHDIALVEILPAGFVKQIQIIRMTVDLLDPSATTLTIGAYIPNIIYIQRETNMDATGSRGGGGGNKSKETERHEFETAIESINAGTGLRFRAFQNDLDDMDNELKLQEAWITIEHDRITQEVIDRRDKDNELSSTITQTAKEIRSEVKSTAAGLQSEIKQNADNISLVVSNGKIKSAEIVASINRSGSEVKISADHIVLDGTTIASLLDGQTILCNYINANTGVFGPVTATNVATGDIQINGSSTLGSASCSSISSTNGFHTGSYTATWQSYTARYCTLSTSYSFIDTGGSTRTGRLVSGYTDTTIYYLGRT